MRFFGFAGLKLVVVYNRPGTLLIWITWRLILFAHYRHTPISPNFNQGMKAAGPVLPLISSYHKVSTVASFLLDCSGSLPIRGHVISVSWRHRRGSGIHRLVPKKHSQSDQRTSDTLIGYLPIFQMLPIFSLCIRYRWYSFE